MTMLLRSITIILSILLLLSCQKDDDVTTSNQVGSIEGFAKIHTSFGNQLFTGGMQVTLLDSDPELFTFTSPEGFYRFEGIIFDQYNLRFEKEGFGTYIRTNIFHNELQTIVEPRDFLSQKSDTEIADLQISLEDDGVTVQTFTSPPANGIDLKDIRFFISNTSDVSETIYRYFTPVLEANSFPETIFFSFAELIEKGFDPGTTIYIRAYGDSFYSNTYLSPSSFQQVFPNLNPVSAVAVSFVLP